MMRILSRESTLPVSIERVRNFLRIASEAEDDLLESLILSAIEEVETYTGLLLTKCVCEMIYEETSQASGGLLKERQKRLLFASLMLPF